MKEKSGKRRNVKNKKLPVQIRRKNGQVHKRDVRNFKTKAFFFFKLKDFFLIGQTRCEEEKQEQNDVMKKYKTQKP